MRKLRLLPLLLVAVVGFSSVAAMAQPPPVGFARLRGENEVPPVATAARGTATFWLEPSGDIKFELVVRRMDNITGAHIHEAPAGVNGPIIVDLLAAAGNPDLTGENHVVTGSFTPPEGLLEKFDKGETYVNVHSTEFPGGEIRGQVRS